MDTVSLGLSKETCKKSNLKGKYRVLSMIREHKTILFGPISNKESKDIRSEKWKQIFAFAASLRVVPVNKDYMYARDVFWQNCKKYAIAKLENCKVGRNICKLTACDRISLEIIGRANEADGFEIESDPEIKHTWLDSETSCSVTSTNVIRSRRVSKLKTGAALRGHSSLAVKKQRLVVEHLQLLNHKTKLEIALMEKQLGLQPSVFTKGFHETASTSFDSSFDEQWHCKDEHSESENATEAPEIEDEIDESESKPLILF